MRYAYIERCRDRYPVRMMCRLLQVSHSGYYAWRGRPESSREQRNRELLPQIRKVHEQSKGVYGSPRVHAELVASGVRVGRHKVAKLMRLERLRGCPKRRFKTTTEADPSHPKAKNLLRRNFSASAANQRWAADLTYISTRQGWLYLAVVMDLYSRRIVGWSMGRRMDRRLVLAALRMALEARQPAAGLIHHSDRDAQYSSDDFRNELARHGIACSMSKAGNCYDNAAVESFFASLKRERVNRNRYSTREQARADLFEYIEVFYNRKRRHGYLGNISPVEFEEQAMQTLKTVH
jgi:transposase InsO family protein